MQVMDTEIQSLMYFPDNFIVYKNLKIPNSIRAHFI